MADKRNYNIDLLRILAALAVVTIHVSGEQVYQTKISDANWFFYNLYESGIRWSVPVFVMISGSFLLDPAHTLSPKKLYTQNLLRIITAFFCWSTVYALGNVLILKKPADSLVKSIVSGPVHFWFLYMIAWMYIVTPLLRKLTAHKQRTAIVTAVLLLVTSVIPTVFRFVSDEANARVTWIFNKGGAYGETYIVYISVYLLGYLLSVVQLKKPVRLLLYLAGVFSWLLTAWLTYRYSLLSGIIDERFHSYMTVNVLIEGCAVFVLLQHLPIRWNDKTKRIVVAMSRDCFGIYLVHPIIINAAEWIGLRTTLFPAFLSVPVISVLVFAVSLGVSAVLNRIPVLKKYIV